METLQWRSHASSIIGESARFYKFGVYVDCCLLVEGKRIKAHKLILAAASAYFQVLFMTRRGKSSIKLENVKYDDVKSILDFIYDGVVDIPVTRVASFMKTAKELQIRALAGYLHKNVSHKKTYDSSRKEMSNRLLDVLKDRQKKRFKTKDTLPQGDTILCEDNSVKIKEEVLDTTVDDPRGPTFESCKDFQHGGQLTLNLHRSGKNCEQDIDKQSTISFKSQDWLVLKEDYQRRLARHLKMRNELRRDGGSNLRSKRIQRRSVGGKVNHRSASKENEVNFPANQTLELSETGVSGGTNTIGPNTQPTNVSNSTSGPLRCEAEPGKSKIPNSDVIDAHLRIVNTNIPDDVDSHNSDEVDIVLERFTVGTIRFVESVGTQEQSRIRKSSISRDPNDLGVHSRSREPNCSREQNLSSSGKSRCGEPSGAKEEGCCSEPSHLRESTRNEGSKKTGLSNPIPLTSPSHENPHRLKESSLSTGPQEPKDPSHPSESATPQEVDTGTSEKTVTFCTSEKEKRKEKKRTTRMVKTGTADRPHACPYCPSVFKRATHCKEHIATHTGSHPYKCNFCPKAFIQKANLIVHIHRHKGEKPFVSPHRQKAFTLNSTLQDHNIFHSGEKPYKCDFCSKRFYENAPLKRHLRKHTEEKPFHCIECNSHFLYKSTLRAHLRTHTGVRPFECSVCRKSFITRNTLTVHMRSHTGERPYECKVCNKSFSQTSSLNRHLESMKHNKNQLKEAN